MRSLRQVSPWYQICVPRINCHPFADAYAFQYPTDPRIDGPLFAHCISYCGPLMDRHPFAAPLAPNVCYWSTLESVLFAGSLRLLPAQYGSNHKTIHTRRHHAHLFGESPPIVRLISKLLVGVLQCDRHNGSMVPAIDRQQHDATFYTVSHDRFLSRWPHISRHINCYVQYMQPWVYGEAFCNWIVPSAHSVQCIDGRWHSWLPMPATVESFAKTCLSKCSRTCFGQASQWI